jgi:hypothetical protein
MARRSGAFAQSIRTSNVRRSGVNSVDCPGRGAPSCAASTSRSTPVSWSFISSAEENREFGSSAVDRFNSR